MKQHIVIVSPAAADANNGNGQTARRWQQLLQPRYRVRIVQHWPDGPEAAHDACMLALHARKSANAIAAWASARAEQALAPAPALAVVLTGTDLYRDIHSDWQAQESLQRAQQLVVLQEHGADALPQSVRHKARVIFQSTSERQTLPKTERHVRALMVGHLREEKSPQTLFSAARLLTPKEGIFIDHIGAALDPSLGAQAEATAYDCPHYRWLGALPYTQTRRRIQQAHVLVHASAMEGGAHVVMEAVRAGTPVIASRIAGNVGMLGVDYSGYFDWNDARQLVTLLRRCHDRATDPLYTQLQAQCAARAPLFAPQAEQAALLRLVAELLDTQTNHVT
jgi:putative glycosyltransferase (TIGR04348 family)